MNPLASLDPRLTDSAISAILVVTVENYSIARGAISGSDADVTELH